MSMLTRKGTLARKQRGSARSSRRSNKSIKSSTSSISVSLSGSVRKNRTEHSNELNSDYGNSEHRSQHPLRTFADVVLSFDDDRQLVRTSTNWEPPAVDEPEYGATLYQIKEAYKESDNVIDFGFKASNILCNTLLVTVFVGISIAVPVAMISIGVKYLDDCPKEPRIPIYLLVGGCFGLIKLLSTLWKNIQSRRIMYQDNDFVFDDHDVNDPFSNTTFRTMETILLLFLIGWQITGTYWTLSVWMPNFKQLLHEPSNWCDKTVYIFTVYQICGTYVVIIVFLSVLFSLLFYHKCCNIGI